MAEVDLEDRTGRPRWVTVKTGVLGRRETFVPLAAARIDSNRLVVEASKEQVARAPQVDEGRHISSQDEAEIYRYYGFSIDPAEHTGTSADPGVDDAMTRSEEHLVVGTRQSEATRVRLRKYVVTEMATVQVPVRHEEVRLEQESITDAESDAAYAGGSVTDITEITDAEQEIILHAERPVVTTETVAVERVRLGKDTITSTGTVSGQVRKERIELDDPTEPGHG